MIEQAKGAVMVSYGLTAEGSFELLRFHSQTAHVKLRAIAAGLTALLPTSLTRNEAVHQCDRLIDDVTSSLRMRREPARAAVGGHGG